MSFHVPNLATYLLLKFFSGYEQFPNLSMHINYKVVS
jgi:hypothetical protein